MKTNPTHAVLTDPFPSQQQLIDHMSNQGHSSSLEEIRMMSSDTISLQTQSNNYDKPADKKEDHSSSGKAVFNPNHREAYSRYDFASTQEYS